MNIKRKAVFLLLLALFAAFTIVMIGRVHSANNTWNSPTGPNSEPTTGAAIFAASSGDTIFGHNELRGDVTKTVTLQANALIGDLNGDGTVNILDAIVLSNSFGLSTGQPGFNPNADINGDGTVDILDAIILMNHFGQHL
jgi:hypothetical protein